ncbi:MAG: hypothetical protein K9H49_03780 [Bacteroidales bacterium]|nr:hypothetical protein [Bacteroidales bacterium]MCF8389411.1 hypothetical protein [Bacteroidales bacterium]
MKNISLFALLIIIALKSNAQPDQSSSLSYKTNGISIGLLGAPQWPVGLSLDQMITQRISLEVGAGIFSGGLGVRYYLSDPGTRRFNYYTQPNFMIYYDTPNAMFYLPLGISYVSKNNFQYSFDAGIMYSEAIEPMPSPWFGGKIGYRFGQEFGSEDKSLELEKKNYVSLSIGATTPVAGFTYERILNNYIGVEAGLGIISAGLGTKIYPLKLKKNSINFHTGVSHNYFAFVFIGESWQTYFPFGLDYINNKNIRFTLDVGPMMDWYSNIGSQYDVLPSFNIRIGKGF